eukprot:7382698-Prymnesium_polylepis.2
MPKPPCSNSCATHRKPPWRTRLATSGEEPCRWSAACSTSHRDAGMTRSRSRPHWLAIRSAHTLATPFDSATLTPASFTSVPSTAGSSVLPCFSARVSIGLLPCRWSASCRAVGWSKTSVLGSVEPLPAARCS